MILNDRPRVRLALGLLAAAGIVLKIVQWYYSRSLWLDEEMLLLNARDRSFWELGGSLWLNQAAPIGWLSLERLVISVFGATDRAVRAVPVLFSMTTLCAAWWLATRRMTLVAGAVFVTLCGIGQWITFYGLEAKPYSADAFWALFLSALVLWALEPGVNQEIRFRRTATWWGTAAVGQWVSFGAVFATPGYALVLCVGSWRQSGKRTALRVAAQGLLWLGCFGAHYFMSIRVASSDEFLKNHWVAGFPPAGASVRDALVWLLAQAKPLATHPGGADMWILFWSTVAYGVAVLLATQPMMGLLVLSTPLTASVLAVLQVVPFSDRLALWIVPSAYAAIAVAAGDVFRQPRLRTRWRSLRIPGAFAFSVAALILSVHIVTLGSERIIIRSHNHGFEDHRALRILTRQWRPGDVMLTTRFGLPAVWWYGDASIAEPNGGTRLPNGSPILEIRHQWEGVDGCRNANRLRALSLALKGARRAAVYLGFGSNDPAGFQNLVLDDLNSLGDRVLYSAVGPDGIIAIYDLRQSEMQQSGPAEKQSESVHALTGCVDVKSARRW